MILFPAIDILGGRAVRLARGSYDDVTPYNDDPAAQAIEFAEAGAEWVHVVDLDGAKRGEPVNSGAVRRIIESSGLKVEIGGGIRSMATIEGYLDAGASRIVVGTKLATDPGFVRSAVRACGDRLVAGVDARNGMVEVSGWTESSGIPADELVAALAGMGIGHLVYTDISRDGMRSGVDAAAYERIAAVAGFPVVASGGVASISDIEALAAVSGSVEGVIAGKAIYEGSLDISSALAVCAAAGEGAKEGACAAAGEGAKEGGDAH